MLRKTNQNYKNSYRICIEWLPPPLMADRTKEDVGLLMAEKRSETRAGLTIVRYCVRRAVKQSERFDTKVLNV